MRNGWQCHLTWPNNWPLLSCVIFSLVAVTSQSVLTWFVYHGISIPVVHQINGFILLAFIPGILILRILRIHNISIIESIIFSVGLSLFLEMALGICLNFVLPHFQIAKPLSLLPMTTSICICVVILTILTILLDRRLAPSREHHAIKLPTLNPLLYLVFLLLLFILAITISNTTGNNLALIICILAVAVTVLLCTADKFIPPALYGPAIFIIGLGLLYQTTLLTPYLVGPDIYIEHFIYNLVAQSGVWDLSISQQVNSCLSIVILAPFFAYGLNLSGIWVFKAVYPLLFSLVPLALFSVFRIQFGANRAFLTAFFFMAVPAFSMELISICRQQVAELFFAAVLLLLVGNGIRTWQKFTLFCIFSLSIILSHYTVGLIYTVFLMLLIILLPVIRSKTFVRAWDSLTVGVGKQCNPDRSINSEALPAKLLAVPIVLSLAVAAALYCLTSSGYIQALLTGLWQEIINWNSHLTSQPVADIVSTFIGGQSPLIRAALGLDFMEVSVYGKIFRVLQYATQALIIVGFLRLLFRPATFRVRDEYIVLSIASFMALLAMAVIPTLASAINATRWYHIALFTLAPYCVIGGEWAWQGIKWLLLKTARRGRLSAVETDTASFRLYFSMILLVPYFLFTSGLIFEITGQTLVNTVDIPYSFALTGQRLNLTLSYRLQDGAAARWLAGKSKLGLPVYTDDLTWAILQLQGFSGELRQFNRNEKPLPPAYLYFSSANTRDDLLAFTKKNHPGQREYEALAALPVLNQVVASGNRIYNNGSARIVIIE